MESSVQGALLRFVGGAGLVWALGGCTTPIGADPVTTRQAHAQVEECALRTGRPGADTVALLHRFDLDRLAARHPDEAVQQLHRAAVATGERDLLFALAELSYAAGDHLRRSAKPGSPCDARDYYLGSAVYAWLFLFGEGEGERPVAFDRRFRWACDYYNYGLGLAFAQGEAGTAAVVLEGGRRKTPVGDIEIRFGQTDPASPVGEFDQLLMADRFRVRGLTLRNRSPGVGAPLLAVGRLTPELGFRRCSPATLLLRVEASLAGLEAGTSFGSLELHSGFGNPIVSIGGSAVPLEVDLTAHAAYVLNQSSAWSLGKRRFRAPGDRSGNQLIPLPAFRRGRVPVVLVHGTFSSPITWAELNNTLAADPVLRRRYQTWAFMYGSGNPLAVSAADLRDALTGAVRRLDPDGTDPDLRQMVVIGHSQGGLLTKLTATRTGDALWRALSTTPLDELDLSGDRRAELERVLVVEPLPFVRRVVFISTPHRGSYLAGGFARMLGSRLVSLPAAVVSQGRDVLSISKDSRVGALLRGRTPTSLDGMSPKNPVLLALADLPVSSSVKAHSIVPVRGDGDYREGRDGLVSYQSAHVDYAESELVVRGEHSCQNMAATIEEVRRILHEHLRAMDAGTDGRRNELRPDPLISTGAGMSGRVAEVPR